MSKAKCSSCQGHWQTTWVWAKRGLGSNEHPKPRGSHSPQRAGGGGDDNDVDSELNNLKQIVKGLDKGPADVRAMVETRIKELEKQKRWGPLT